MAEQQQPAEAVAQAQPAPERPAAQAQSAPEQPTAEQKPEPAAGGAIQPTRRAVGISRFPERALPSLLSQFFAEPFFGTPFRRGAFGIVRRMMDDLDRLMEDVGAAPRLWREQEAAGPALAWSPRIEEFRRGDEFVVRVDLPGLREDDVRVTVADEVLSIEGERREKSEQREAGMYRSEVRYGSFRRSIPLPEDADLDSVTARFEDGVLEVMTKLPSGKHPEPRRIEIKSGPGAATEETPESVH